MRLLSFLAVALQRAQRIEVAPFEDALDVLQGHVERAMQENLLQREQGILVVVPVAVLTDTRRLEEPDLVVVGERTREEPGQLGELPCHQHGASIDDDVTSMSRGGARRMEKASARHVPGACIRTARN
jgi:hypothetical protein